MYEKYSGLPDTTKSTKQIDSRPADRTESRPVRSSSGQTEYYPAQTRNATQASSKRVSARKAKARKRKLILGGMGLAFLALIVIAVLVLVKSCSGPTTVDPVNGTFRSGVTINGMDVSGKTVGEVRLQLETNENTFLERIAITLSSAELNATITGAEMSATTNLDEVIEQALAGGANQSYSTAVLINEAALATRIDAIKQAACRRKRNLGLFQQRQAHTAVYRRHAGLWSRRRLYH
jgi:hypothetical protein